MRPVTHRGSRLLCSLLLVLGVAVLLAVSVRRNGGRIVLLADDPYIHMAMAKNLVGHGAWGITSERFTSTSSSPLWTCLLAMVYLVFGVGELAPLVLSVLFGLVAVIVLGRLLERHNVAPAWALAVSILAIVATPLATIALCGMEHTLQMALSLAFAAAAAEAIRAGRGAAHSRDYRALLVLAPLLVAVRYEGLFLVGGVAVLFGARRRPGRAFGVALAGAAPAVAYGAVSLAHGWFALPNSVLLKGHAPSAWTLQGLLSYGASGFERLARCWDLSALALAAVIILWAGIRRGARLNEAHGAMLVIFLATLAAHVLLAGINYRYEAYLVVLGIAACAVGTRALLGGMGPGGLGRPRRPGVVGAWAVAAVLALPLLARGGRATAITVRASQNIYQQQYQMGLFLRRFYPGGAIAVNDIGAVSYLSDAHLLDLFGLASIEVARAKRGDGLSATVINQLASRGGVELAVLYAEWYEGLLPRTWVKVGTWGIPDNVVCGGDTVTFYATSVATRGKLVETLRAFSARLPDEVVVSPQIRAGTLGASLP